MPKVYLAIDVHSYKSPYNSIAWHQISYCRSNKVRTLCKTVFAQYNNAPNILSILAYPLINNRSRRSEITESIDSISGQLNQPRFIINNKTVFHTVHKSVELITMSTAAESINTKPIAIIIIYESWCILNNVINDQWVNVALYSAFPWKVETVTPLMCSCLECPAKRCVFKSRLKRSDSMDASRNAYANRI